LAAFAIIALVRRRWRRRSPLSTRPSALAINAKAAVRVRVLALVVPAVLALVKLAVIVQIVQIHLRQLLDLVLVVYLLVRAVLLKQDQIQFVIMLVV
jgi:hypothetical protein